MPGKIIALAGPSGVGKNFVKQAIKNKFFELSELTVYTTRTKRLSDGLDRKTDISVKDFLIMKKEGKIVAAHQPFGPEGDWYGFSREQIDKMLENNETILTEIHPDNISLFKESYGDRVFTIALTAEKEYLEHNLRLRDSEKETDKASRLNKAINEIETIKKMQREELINGVIEVNWDNRDELLELVIDKISSEIKPSIEGETRLKFK